MGNNNNNNQNGLVFKTTNYGEQATMWFRESKKSNVFKFTKFNGTTTYTYILDLSQSPMDFGKGSVFPVKVLKGKTSSSQRDNNY